MSSHRCVFIHPTAGVCARARARAPGMPVMRLRLNDETPQTDVAKIQAGGLTAYERAPRTPSAPSFLLFLKCLTICLWLSRGRERTRLLREQARMFSSRTHHASSPLQPPDKWSQRNRSVFYLLCSNYGIVKQRPFSHTNQANQGAVKELY